MYRACAILLLSMISFWLSVPAFASSGEPQLPACCRAKGLHKCGMRTPHSENVPAIANRCPYYPSVDSIAVGGSAPLPVIAHTLAMRQAAVPSVQAQAGALYRISFARSSQKRGPPTLL